MKPSSSMFTLAAALLALAPAAEAQTYPTTPTRCGQVFEVSNSLTSFCRFTARYTSNQHIQARAAADRICSSKFGSACGKASRISTSESGCRGFPSRRCTCVIKDTFKCVAGGKPDLVATRFSASVSASGAVTLDLQLCNLGTAAATFTAAIVFPQARVPSSRTCMAYGTTPFVEAGGIVLAPKECVGGVFSLGVLPAGRYGMTLWADPRCAVDELNGKNNYRHVTFDVKPRLADLRASIKPAAGYPRGRTTAYDVTLCRTGPETRPVDVAIKHYAAGTPIPSPTAFCGKDRPYFHLDARDVDIPAGCTTVRDVPVPAPYVAPGTRKTFKTCILVDWRCGVTELSETNNLACTTVTVSGS